MRILLVNDDGVMAPGLRTLKAHLEKAGHQLIVVAPDTERSASSHSITLRKDIFAKKLKENEWSVSGTPVDCTVIAIQKLIKDKVDLVVSGINAGQNMGEDVLYSGTVAAAIEAAMLGQKAIALSINAYKDQLFDSAASCFVQMLDSGIAQLIGEREVLNINFPNIEADEIKGIRLTKTGHRKYYNFITIIEEKEDEFSYRVGGEGARWEPEKGSDSEAVIEGYISITPLGFELTKKESFVKVENWIEQYGYKDFQKANQCDLKISARG